MRRPILVLFAVLSLFLLSGCMKLDVDMDVHSDDTVDGTMIVAMSSEFVDMMNSMGGEEMTTEDMFPTEDMPEGVESEAYEEDGWIGQKLTFEGVALEEFGDTMDADDGTGSLTIVRDGDVYRVDGTFDMSMEGGDAGMLGGEELMQDAEMRVQLSFPGDVTEGNGEIDGNTVTWTPEAGEVTELTAVAEADEPALGGGGGFPLWIAIAVAALVLLAVVVGVVVMRGRKKAGPPAPPSGAAGPPTVPPVDQGQTVPPAPSGTPPPPPAPPAS